MNDKQQMFESARKFAAQFSGFMAACEELGKVGSLDQAADEATKRLAEINAEIEAANAIASIAKAKQDSENAASLAKAQAEADGIVAAGKRYYSEQVAAGDDARAKASKSAEKIVADATAEAEQLAVTTQANLLGSRKELAELTAKIADNTGALAKLTEATRSRQSVHDELTRSLAAIGERVKL